MDRTRDAPRPDPDAMLARAKAEESQRFVGRLKIFFGMCPGVGKTFAMLQEAQEKRRAGVEVVLGYIETHARPETDALKLGLEELPPRWVEYRGVRLREFDLDAALRRKPSLLLVDELAHTNADGLRHTKRWQDLMELLDAGIDVSTTVNVQHVESLNDVVARISGIVVHETIPDSILERADEIELIDLPPDDLLQRLREGKVYVPEQAARAAERFFRKEILVALRELALRRTAERVNAQVQAEKAGHAIQGTWPTTERLMVCVGPSPLSARVIRVARRMAAGFQCEWLAVSVETPSLPRTAKERIARNMHLAERLGARTTALTGDSVATEVAALARKRNVTKIIVGKPATTRWRELLTGSIVDQLIRQSGEIDVLVVKGEQETPTASPSRAVRPRAAWRPYAWSVVVMAVCTAVAGLLFPILSSVNLAMVYLAGIVFVATRFGEGPAATTAVLAPLSFNFFFTEPYYSFAIRDAQYVVTFVVLLATGLVVSGLAQRVRRQAENMRVRYFRTLSLYFMSRQLAAAADKDGLARVAAKHLADVFGRHVVILLPRSGASLTPFGEAGEWFRAGPNESAVAQWAFDHQQWAGQGTDTLPSAQALYIPLVCSDRSLGVLGLRQREAREVLEPDQRHLLDTFATQLAIALERAEFAEQAEHARIAAESEQLRSSMLSCVSHDLRTPLAAIAGSAGALLEDHGRLTEQQRKELLHSICEEGTRMNQLVGKLLDMTRLESPGLRLSKEWYPLDDLVGSALARLDETLRGHAVETRIPADLALVYIDGVLIEEVFVNLLENAARYTPSGSTISIAAQASFDGVCVEVYDDGPGLQPGDETRIFDKFVRVRPRADRSGTGLGLTICRAIVQLHDGDIGARNRPEGGACFWFTLPTPANPPPPPMETTAPPPAASSRRSENGMPSPRGSTR